MLLCNSLSYGSIKHMSGVLTNPFTTAIVNSPIPVPSTKTSSTHHRLLSQPHDRRCAGLACNACRRRVRYEDDGGDAFDENNVGFNAEIAALESYSERARGRALLVRATVDGEEEEVLIFKGFSSLLSSGTFSDPSRSVIPARAEIISIDVIRSPFDPSNIEYLERDVPWDIFKSRLTQNSN